jgi:hypothetical protein
VADSQEAEHSGGGNSAGKFKALLTKKFGPLPMWAYLLVLVLVAAYIIKKRQAAKAAATPAATDASAQNNAQTFPYAQQMPYTSDIFINNPGPVSPAATPAPNTSLPAKAAQATVGTNINDWINNLEQQRKAGYGEAAGVVAPITLDTLKALNPTWSSNFNPNNTFKSTTSVKLQ